MGRFLSRDPIVPDPADSQGLNRYSYVMGNPINLIDPSGHKSLALSGGSSPIWEWAARVLGSAYQAGMTYGPRLGQWAGRLLQTGGSKSPGATGPLATAARTRSLAAADLGIRGTVNEVRGTFTIAENRAIVHIDMIRASITNPFEVINNLAELAKAEGATILRVQGTLANPDLMRVLGRRYDLTPQGAIDYFEIILK